MEVVSSNIKSDCKLQNVLNKVNSAKIVDDKAYRHCVKGDALRVKKHFKESIDEYLLAVSHDESNYAAFKGLGISYKKIGLLKSSIEALKNAKKLLPFDKEVHYELGTVYIQNSEPEKSLHEFKRAIKLYPDYSDAEFNLAIAHELLEEYDMAVCIYKRIIEKSPSCIGAYNNLASVYMKLSEYKEAVAIFKRLLEINPDYSRAYLGIAVAFDKIGRVNNSIRYYKKYVELKPNSVNLPHINNRIDELRRKRKLGSNTTLKLVVN